MSYQPEDRYGVPEEARSRMAAMRVSHADRERAADVLGAGFAEGRLDREEHERRLERVHRARTYGELYALVADLPHGPAAVPALPPALSFPPVRPRTNGSATAAMVCGLLVPVLGITAVPAVVLGRKARGEIRRTGESGEGMAVAGLALGWAAIVVFALFLFALVLGAPAVG